MIKIKNQLASNDKNFTMTVTNRKWSTKANGVDALISQHGHISKETYGDFDKKGIPLAAPRIYDIKYQNVIVLLYIHFGALYGIYLCFTSAKMTTVVFAFILYILGGFGITGGAHRLWTHKTYKAKYYFEVLTLFLNCLAYQQPVINWVRDHRLHHKYSDTDADPHNARRGFFYSHIGWLMVRKTDLVKERGKTIDISDLLNNPLLQFQKKYQVPLFGLICFILPTVIPILCWGETFMNSWHLNIFRYTLTLNAALLVNSFAHIYGYKPYDKNILPTQNYFVSLLTGGEGFHNYHHCYPWDYRTAELGNNYLNPTTIALDILARLGWVYDLKTTNPLIIESKAQSTGDGTNCWGFDVQRTKRLDEVSERNKYQSK